MNRISRATMNHRASNSSLRQAQSSWQDINRNSNYGVDFNLVGNLAITQNPPLAHQNAPQHNQIHQPETQVQSAPLTRAAKTHRYMTRQTLSASPSTACNGLNLIDNNGVPQNVVIRPLAFYDEKFELIRTTWLRNYGVTTKPNESIITFTLSIEQADMIGMSEGMVQVILRFCYFDDSAPQNDNFPPDIVITVNDRKVQLPPAIQNPNKPGPGKRAGQHVDITKLVKLSPHVENFVKVTWVVDPNDLTRQYGTSIIIGERQSAETLLQRIIARGSIDPAETKNRILDSDSEVATTNLQCSLMCPLAKMRMVNPCKAITCQHIPCFDASTYLQMNEKKATWNCPVCFQPAYYPDLKIDGYFMDILQKTDPSVTDVTLNLDGTWDPVIKVEQSPTSANKPMPELIVISDDED